MKNKQTYTWISSQVFDTFFAFCASVGYHERVSERNSFTAPRNAAHPLELADLASASPGLNSSLGSRFFLTIAFPWLLLTALFCWLFSSAHCPLLLTALGPCLPSSSSGLEGNLARRPFVRISWQNRQKDLLISTHLQPQKRILPIMPHLSALTTFSRKSIMIGCSMSQKTVRTTLFTNYWDRYFFFTKEPE